MKTLLIALIILVPQMVTAADDAPFLGLDRFVGTWRLSSPQSESDKKFRLTYRFISRNSALVEVYGDPNQQTTETLFHRDGQRLMATHYCARGNQPRLIAKPGNEQDTVVFEFLDATNLTDKNAPHMVGMKFTFIDKNRFEKEEIYLANGKEESSVMSLVRDM